jgi:hypothetical protein
MPYVEVKRLEHAGTVHRCYTDHAKLIAPVLVVAIGFGMMWVGG